MNRSRLDRKWITVAKKRLEELRSGKVEAIPGEEVFAKIWKRFSNRMEPSAGMFVDS